jgi:hypothetical protein
MTKNYRKLYTNIEIMYFIYVSEITYINELRIINKELARN